MQPYQTPRPHLSTPRSGLLASPALLDSPSVRTSSATPIQRKTPLQKVHEVLTVMEKHHMTLGDFLYHLLSRHQPTGKSGPANLSNRPTSRHVAMLSAFLRGKTTHTMSTIIEMIYNHPFSKPKRQSTERPLHFPTAQDFKTIKHARPALSAWAILLCVSECAKQIRRLSKKSAGLHLRLSQNARTRATQASATPSWERILEVGSSVGMENLVKSVAPLVMYFVMAMLKSKRRQRSESSETEARGPRPSLHVAISIVGSLVFGSNRHANALAFGNSVWMFANRAHYAVFPVLSHFGVTTVYQSLLNGLRSLASMDQDRKSVV